MARQKISGRDLAERLGWSRMTVTRRLNDDPPLRIDELAEVAKALGVPVMQLLGNGSLSA